MKGSKKPIGFYTTDMHVDDLEPSKVSPYTKSEYAAALREKKTIIRLMIEEKVFEGEEILNENKDLKMSIIDHWD